jgi:hypothetical protein
MSDYTSRPDDRDMGGAVISEGVAQSHPEGRVIVLRSVQARQPHIEQLDGNARGDDWPDEHSNLAVFRIYRDSQTRFCGALLEAAEESRSRELTIAEIDFLRTVNVYHLTQLFYFFRAHRIATKETIERYIELHNSDMEKEAQILTNKKEHERKCRENEDKVRRQKQASAEIAKSDTDKHSKERVAKVPKLRRGPDRFQKGIIRPHRAKLMVRNLIEGLEEGCLRFALADLQCLLTESMVAETCSTTCKVLDSLGLLRWYREGNEVVIDSKGIIERCCRDHLAFAASSLREIFTASP